jgi:hypothetical protein
MHVQAVNTDCEKGIRKFIFQTTQCRDVLTKRWQDVYIRTRHEVFLKREIHVEDSDYVCEMTLSCSFELYTVALALD